MYIPEFICGVIATILSELIVVIIAALVNIRKERKGRN